MLTRQQLGWLTKKTEIPEYNNLISQLNGYGGRSGVMARINSLVSSIANIKTQLKAITDNNYSLANERDTLQKAHASLVAEIKRANEEEEKRKQELIEAQKLLPQNNVMPVKRTVPPPAKRPIRVKWK